MKKIIQILILGICFNTVNAQFTIKEGINSVYLFLTDQTPGSLNTSSEFSGIKVYRMNGNRNIEIGKLAKVNSPDELKKRTNIEVLKFIMELKQLSSENEAWNYFKTHFKLTDYGLLALDPDFLVALGVCYKDTGKLISKGNTLEYKVTYIPKNKSLKPEEHLSEIKLIGKLNSSRPKAKNYFQSDSIINVQWEMPIDKTYQALMATIYKKEGNYGTFKRVERILMVNRDSVSKRVISYSEKVKPHTQYAYYARPTSITGLEGMPSDTISVISKNFSNISQIELMTVRDTTSGLLLTWNNNMKLQKFTAGIVLERSLNPKSGYVCIDTISKQRNSYLDANIFPNLLYHYRLRFLSTKQMLMAPSAHASAIHHDNSIFIEPPVSLKIKPTENDVLLTWKKSIFPEISGYYVYRSNSGKDDWQLVSNFVNDTLFIDKSIQSGNTLYKYAVTAAGYSGKRSNFSNTVFGTISKVEKPIAPIGLQTAIINGAVNLLWRSLNTEIMQNPTFNIYRAKGNLTADEIKKSKLLFKEFQKINSIPIKSDSFIDNNVEKGNTYSYTVTLIDDYGNESEISTIEYVELSLEELGAPTNVGIRKIENDIIISWDKSYQKGVKGYVIYRRAKGQKEYEKIGTVNSDKFEYKETDIQKKKYYYYVITTIGKSIKSPKSIEVGIPH